MQIGDRVKATNPSEYHAEARGLEGSVIATYFENLGVEFDRDLAKGHECMFHKSGRRGKWPRCFWMGEGELQEIQAPQMP